MSDYKDPNVATLYRKHWKLLGSEVLNATKAMMACSYVDTTTYIPTYL